MQMTLDAAKTKAREAPPAATMTDACQKVVANLSPTETVSLSLTYERTLGSGRSATARLVRVEGLHGEPCMIVEKVFRPGLLTRLIYALAFQAPFGYRYNAAAIITAFYRRRVARALLAAHDIPLRISNALYYRWSEDDSAFILGTEYVAGPGLQVNPVNTHMVRSRFTRQSNKRPPTDYEILLPAMRRLERLLRDCGLVGSGWQVCPAAIVSTANFIRCKDEFWVIDLESGIPAIMVPYYVIYGLFHGQRPMFDDLEAGRWSRWCDRHKDDLLSRLDQVEYQQLVHNSEQLCIHAAAWKKAELAIFRNPFHLIPSDNRTCMKTAALERWRRLKLIDEEEHEWYGTTSRFTMTRTFLCGLLPGSCGRFLRRLSGNRQYRQDTGRFLRDREFRRAAIASYTGEKCEKWRQQRRIADSTQFTAITRCFLISWLLSYISSVKLQRFLVDREVRGEIRTACWRFFTSESFQTEYAKIFVFRTVTEWTADGRLTPEDETLIRSRVEDGSMQEYIRCFAFHATLKLLSPLTTSLKIAGFALLAAGMSSAAIDTELTSMYGMIPSALYVPLAILLIVNTSILRTLVTLSRIVVKRGSHFSYGIALFVGMLPTVGSFAYPLQMYWTCRELSFFLTRHIVARVGQVLPIYGGKHTRTEVWMVQLANLPFEALGIAETATNVICQRTTERATTVVASEPTSPEDAAFIEHLIARFETRK